MSEINPQTSESILGIPEIELEVVVHDDVQWPVDPSLTTQEMAADAKATGDALGNLEAALSDTESRLESEISGIGAGVIAQVYPVGSIIMTTSSNAPSVNGTWTEILLPLKWGDAQNGNRNYAEGTGTGSVHFWLRTA